jgi:hypothetical protein
MDECLKTVMMLSLEEGELEVGWSEVIFGFYVIGPTQNLKFFSLKNPSDTGAQNIEVL